MAKFTCTVPLNIAWEGNHLIGTSTTTYRIPDALYDEFVATVVPSIPGTVTWVTTDEIGALGTPAHSSLTGVTADQHHAQVHSISGADHTGSLAHSALASIGANDHHAQVHSISGADHSGTLTHAALGSVTADQHHAQSHNHSSASDGTALSPATFNIPGGIGFSAGTTFPGSPATNQVCRRTDLAMEFYYDGTRWLSSTLHTMTLDGFSSLAATRASTGIGPAPTTPGSDIWLVDFVVQFLVNAGTALSASHKWVGTFNKQPTGNTNTLLVTTNIDSGASSVWRTSQTAINALMNSGTLHYDFTDTWTKTGTPGNLFLACYVTYRIVAT